MPVEIGPSDWLFPVSVKNRANASPSNGRQLLVLLPSADILSKEGLEQYLAWCMETHKSFKGGVFSCWDVDDIEFREQTNANLAEKMSSFLRRGDSASDPSGVLSLVVTDVPEDGGATFKLGLAEPLAPGTATPALCLTNLWVLSRKELFDRWGKAIASGKNDEVFDEIARLAKSGRYRLAGGRAWEKAVQEFRKSHSSLRPSIVFRNESEKTICIVVENMKMAPNISPGESKRFQPSGESRRIAWKVRPADDPDLGDKDYDWASGSAYWDSEEIENSIVRLSPTAVGGKRETWPMITVTNSFNAAVRLRMEYENNTTNPPVVLNPFSQYRITPHPHKMSDDDEMKMVFIAESDKAAAPWRREIIIRRGHEPLPLRIALEEKVKKPALPPSQPQKAPEQTKPMLQPQQTTATGQKKPAPQPQPPQPQKAAARPAPTRPVVPGGRVVDWPKSIGKLTSYFLQPPVLDVTSGKKKEGNDFDRLAKWQRFWETGSTDELEQIFRDAVAHVAGCPKGCTACKEQRHGRLGKAKDPKEEVFWAIGSWEPVKQREFCDALVEKVLYKAEDLVEDPYYWWRFCTEKMDDPAHSAKEELSRFWHGLGDRGKEFGRLYCNVELGNPNFERYHEAIAYLPTFEERREKLFKMVLLEEPQTDWAETGRPSAEAVSQMIELLSGREDGK